MARFGVRGAKSRGQKDDRIDFWVLRVPRGGRGVKPRVQQLWLHAGPCKDAEPVATILLPGEDYPAARAKDGATRSVRKIRVLLPTLRA